MSSNPTAVTGALSNLPCHYWADWDPSSFAQQILRRDTRIYWAPQSCATVGRCVGTFYGENPGGGESIYGQQFTGYSPIVSGKKKLHGDPTLRLILETWKYAQSLKVCMPQCEPKGHDYIEVLNLYYFRDPNSSASNIQTLHAWRNHGGASFYNPAISPGKFVLLGWGKVPNTYHESRQALQIIGSRNKIVLPSLGQVPTVISGSSSSLQHYPAAPSGFIQRGLRQQYISDVGAVI